VTRLRPVVLALFAAVASTLWITSCSDAGPVVPIEGRLAVAPTFETDAAGIIEITSIRFTLARSGATLAKDTVIQIASGADSVVLELTVPLFAADEVFSLQVAMVDAAGDTVFRAGPLNVTATASGDPPVIPLTFVYTGTGANAEAVQLVTDTARLFTGETVVLGAIALDSAGHAIPGTPIGWRSLDTTRATVQRPDSGRVVGGSTRGTARIVAKLLTGPADTANVTVQPLPTSLTVTAGDGQSGTVGLGLPVPLEVRAVAADGLGVAGIWIRFTATGGGSLSADSVLADTGGRASVSWTLGPSVGAQSVEVTAPAFPALSASLGATAAAAIGVVSWLNPVDGNWSDGTQWSTGAPPGPNDTVMVTVDGTYTVTLDADASVPVLQVGGASGTQTFAHAGTSLTITDTATFGPNALYVMSDADTLYGDGTVVIEGTLDWSGGTQSGTGSSILTSGATGSLQGSLSLQLDRSLITFGTVISTAANILVGSPGASITNRAGATLDFQGPGNVTGPGTFLNEGSILKTVNSGAVQIVTGVANNTGSVDVQAGDFYMVATGTHTGTFNTAAGTSLHFDLLPQTIDGAITGAGTVGFRAGDATVNASCTASALVLQDGPVTFNAPLTVADSIVAFNGTFTFATGDTLFVPRLVFSSGTLTGTDPLEITGALDWSGGALSGGEVKVLAAGAVGLLSGSTKTLANNYFHNYGTITWTGGDIVFNTFGIVNEPGGVFDIQDPGDTGFGVLWGTAFPAIENRGTLRKSSGSGTTGIGPGLWNYGTIDIQTGTIAPATRLNMAFFHYDGAVVEGNGTLNLAAASTMGPINGDFNPGTSPGILSIAGSLPQDTGSTIDLEINGLIAGTQYDRLQVSGQADIAGSINVAVGFSPAIGDSFTVMTYGSRGASAVKAVTGLDLGGGLTLDTVWTATELALVVRGPPPGPIVFAGDSSGGLSTGLFSVAPDGTARSRFWTATSLYDEYINPRWSPDKSRVTFTYRTGGYSFENQLFVTTIGASPDTVVALVTDTSTYWPRYSPNGTHLAFECGDGYSVMDVCVIGNVTGAVSSLGGIGNGTGKVYLTDFDVVNRNGGPGVFAWDPLNPDRLAFVRDSIDPTGGTTSSRMYTSSYDGAGGVTPVSSDAMDLGAGPLQITGDMDWSTDGQWLAFAATDPTSGVSHIYKIDRNGANLTQLTATTDWDGAPLWSPTGLELLFTRDQSCNFDAWMMNADGSNQRRITDEQVCDFNTDVLGYDWSPDGQEIVLTGFDTAYGNIFIFKLPRTVTAATYFTDRILIGRGADAGGFVNDIQPSWRP